MALSLWSSMGREVLPSFAPSLVRPVPALREVEKVESMRLTPYEVTQLLADLEGIVKRDDSAALRLTIWLRDRHDEAVHIYQESTVMEWKNNNPLVKNDA